MGSPFRLLIMNVSALGDVVWSTALIDAAQQLYGEELSVDLLVRKSRVPLFNFDTRIRNIFAPLGRDLPLLLSPARWAVFLNSLKQPYDLVVQQRRDLTFLAVCAKKKIILDYMQPGVHMVELWRNALEVSNASPSIKSPPLQQRKETLKKVALTSPYVIIHPGNSYQAKTGCSDERTWPTSQWIALIQRICTEFPQFKIVVTGQKGEQALLTEIQASCPNIVDLCHKTTLPEFLSLVQESVLLISGDTGPAHIASALNTPVIALFGPTDPAVTGPFKTKKGFVELLRAPTHRTADISVEEVFKLAKKVLIFKVYPATSGS